MCKVNKQNLFFLILFIGIFSLICINYINAADKTGIGEWENKLYSGAADTGVYATPASESGMESIIKYIGWILNLVMLFGYLLIVRIIWAGYLWMTARGEAERVEDAKKVISHSTIGIVILVALYAISYFVVDALQKVSGYKG